MQPHRINKPIVFLLRPGSKFSLLLRLQQWDYVSVFGVWVSLDPLNKNVAVVVDHCAGLGSDRRFNLLIVLSVQAHCRDKAGMLLF